MVDLRELNVNAKCEKVKSFGEIFEGSGDSQRYLIVKFCIH